MLILYLFLLWILQGFIDFAPFIGVLCILYALIGADKMDEKDLFKDRNIFGYLRFLNVHETFLKREFIVALVVTALCLVSLIVSHIANDATHFKLAVSSVSMMLVLMIINSINYIGILIETNNIRVKSTREKYNLMAAMAYPIYVGVINIATVILAVFSCAFYNSNVYTVSNPLPIVFTLFFTILSLLSTVTGLSIGFKLYLVKLMKKG